MRTAIDSTADEGDRVDFTSAKTKLDGLVHAELIREILPVAMTPQLRKILKLYLEAGDDFLPVATIVEKANLSSVRSVGATLGWLS